MWSSQNHREHRLRLWKTNGATALRRHGFRPGLEGLEDRTVLSILTVMNNFDSGTGSLRDQIAASSSGDTIIFASTVTQPIVLVSSLTLTHNLTIDASTVGGVTVSGGGQTQVFDVSPDPPAIPIPPNVSMKEITVTDGKRPNGGGGILVDLGSSLTLTDCVVEKCTGGGILNQNGSTLTLVGCTVTGNTAGAGAGLDNEAKSFVTATDTTFSDNTVSGGVSNEGGAVLNLNCPGMKDATGQTVLTPAMTLTNCQIVNNTAPANRSPNGIGLVNLTNSLAAAGLAAQARRN
jgi:hypothetical protein